jgi:hypothetical protein
LHRRSRVAGKGYKIFFSANDRAEIKDALKGTLDRSWVDKALDAGGCEIINGYCE